jgi:hypothetical protein
MRLEATLIERAETFLRRPTLAGSAGVGETVPEGLESGACAHRISQATYGRLREMIRRSPHFVPCR